MVNVQHLIGPASFSTGFSVISYNVLLPNSVDGWWSYKMYLPPLSEEQLYISNWDYRRDLLKNRIGAVNANVVCIQEVSPTSFEEDFAFMKELGYDRHEMFKKGRFRPATFWKSSVCELAAPAVHKDRTLLTAFRFGDRIWYVLNCHLQAGKEGSRRLRQIHEGLRAVITLANKLKEKNPKQNLPLIVCGDFNGGAECGAVRYLEDGKVDETFVEDGEAVTSSEKVLPLENPLSDAARCVDREPPSTLIVPELISLLVEGDPYENPRLSSDVVERLSRIYEKRSINGVWFLEQVQQWLLDVNQALGRGSEFREASRQMGWTEEDAQVVEDKPHYELPTDGSLTLQGFLNVYEKELQQGKFWGIAYDLSVLGEPLPMTGVFQARFDRIYYSSAVEPVAVMDFLQKDPCPNAREPSDHLPIAASFRLK